MGVFRNEVESRHSLNREVTPIMQAVMIVVNFIVLNPQNSPAEVIFELFAHLSPRFHQTRSVGRTRPGID